MNFADLIPSLGFPIVCCLALAWFVWKMYTNNEKKNDEREKTYQKTINDFNKQLTKINENNVLIARTLTGILDRLDNIENSIKE